MTQKYKLLENDTKTTWNGRTLYRIETLIDIGSIPAGALGGHIASEKNLSHDGNAQVSGDAKVFGGANVLGNARVLGSARVSAPKHCYVFHCESYSITVTPQNVSVGCQLKTHKEWLKVSKSDAINLGLSDNLYATYKALIKIGMKAVK